MTDWSAPKDGSNWGTWVDNPWSKGPPKLMLREIKREIKGSGVFVSRVALINDLSGPHGVPTGPNLTPRSHPN